MAEQQVTKSVGGGTLTGIHSQLLRTITEAAEQEIVVAPCSGDFKAGASVVIPSTKTIDVTDTPTQLATCVLTDDEGNVIPDAFEFCKWSSGDEEVFTVSENGVITPVAAGSDTLTVTALGVSDTCAVTVTEN